MRRPGWAVVLLGALFSSAATAVVMSFLLTDPERDAPIDPSEALKERIAQLETENESLRARRDRSGASVPEGPSGRRRVDASAAQADAELQRLRRDAAESANASDFESAQARANAFRVAQLRGGGSKWVAVGGRTALDPSMSKEELERLLRDPETDAGQRGAAFALLYRHDVDAAMALADQLLWDGGLSIDDRAVVAVSMAATVSQGADMPSSLRSLATDTGADWKLRRPALSALVVSRPQEALSYVEPMATSSDPETLAKGVEMLMAARDKSYLPLLTRTINRQEARVHAPRLVNTIAGLKDKSWSAVQITGEPDLPIAGDLGTAWASKTQQMGHVWIELTYSRAVIPSQLRVHETHNPGALARVEAKNPDGGWDRIWSGTAAKEAAPRWFEPLLDRVSYETRVIRIIVATDRVSGWNEIDAVELIGAGGTRQWVESARASSSYSD